ncbi:hypothetical protein WG66_004629 [Moniliophthora roreri]|uniref:Uncharacterized protein n=1 Tax=Moniliophthora roreri TaxID=221103 RepID=A0A0W0FGP7_MONRR|nr:hypothetical protein WG66_004629 [Moniliophthora roreri]
MNSSEVSLACQGQNETRGPPNPSTGWPNLDPSLFRIGFDVVHRLQAGQQAPNQHESASQTQPSNGFNVPLSLPPTTSVDANPSVNSPAARFPTFFNTPEFHNLMSTLTYTNFATVHPQNSEADYPHIPDVDVNRATDGKDPLETASIDRPDQTDGMHARPEEERPREERPEEENALASIIPPTSSWYSIPNHTSLSHFHDQIVITPPAPSNEVDDLVSLDKWRNIISPFLLQNARLRWKGYRAGEVPPRSAEHTMKDVLSDDVCKEFARKMLKARIQLEGKLKPDIMDKSGDNRGGAQPRIGSVAVPIHTTSRSTSVSAPNENTQPSTRMNSPSLKNIPRAPRAMHRAWQNTDRSTPGASSTTNSGRRSMSYDRGRLSHPLSSSPANPRMSRGHAFSESTPTKSRKRPRYSDDEDDCDPQISSNRACRSTSRSSHATYQPTFFNGGMNNAYQGSQQCLRSCSPEDKVVSIDPCSTSGAAETVIKQNGVPTVNGCVHLPSEAMKHSVPISPTVTPAPACSVDTDQNAERPLGQTSEDMQIDQPLLASEIQTAEEQGPDCSASVNRTLAPPGHTVPGLWLVQQALDSPGILDCQIHLDADTAQRWQLYEKSAEMSPLEEGTEMLNLSFVCLSYEAVEGIFKSMLLTPEALSEAVKSSVKEWPLQGTLLVQTNPGESHSKTWLPQEMKPNTPLDITHFIRPGQNVIRCIQLAPLRYFFILHATTIQRARLSHFDSFITESISHINAENQHVS